MHSFEVHSHESACRKSGSLGLEQLYVYFYTSEELGTWFVDTLGERLHVKLLRYAHWFMYIRISQVKDNSISMDQDRYAPQLTS